MNQVNFRNYGSYSSNNYGVHTLCFTDAKGNEFYFSYETLVAFKHKGILYVRENIWGTTTGKHLNWIDGGCKEDRLSHDEFIKKYNECFKENCYED